LFHLSHPSHVTGKSYAEAHSVSLQKLTSLVEICHCSSLYQPVSAVKISLYQPFISHVSAVYQPVPASKAESG
jgi:hypothetical protein